MVDENNLQDKTAEFKVKKDNKKSLPFLIILILLVIIAGIYAFFGVMKKIRKEATPALEVVNVDSLREVLRKEFDEKGKIVKDTFTTAPDTFVKKESKQDTSKELIEKEKVSETVAGEISKEAEEKELFKELKVAFELILDAEKEINSSNEFFKKNCQNSITKCKEDDFKAIVDGNAFQISLFEKAIEKVEKISPAGDLKELKDKIIESAKHGKKRIEMSDKLMKYKRLKNLPKPEFTWSEQSKVKKAFKSKLDELKKLVDSLNKKYK